MPAPRRPERPVRARRPIRGASEQVALEIQRHMQAQQLAPGDFLGREEDLAADFGVSRPTLREALKLLSSGNLVRASKGPGGGIFVARTPEQGMGRTLNDAIALMLETGRLSLEELVETRILLEVPVTGLAAYHADAAAIERMREALAAEALVPDDDVEALAVADARYHGAIADAAGNRMLQAITSWIQEVLQPSLMRAIHGIVVQGAIRDQHAAVLAAIEKGDGPRAERAMRDHLLYLRDVLAMTREDASNDLVYSARATSGEEGTSAGTERRSDATTTESGSGRA